LDDVAVVAADRVDH
jgi:hypothetical protein